MAQLSVRIPDNMKEQLEKIAAEDSRSVAFVVKKAIQQYLDGMKVCQDKED